jgi:DNA-binding GntR family transcriptional regulator
MTEPKPYTPRTLADDLKTRLRRALFDGAFKPGQVISIRRIAGQYGVSVIPARDALRGLVAEGALEFRDSRTIVVPVLDAARIRDVEFARLCLEGELARRAFARMTAADLDTLRDIDARLDSAIGGDNIRGYITGNYRFHFHIYRRANAPVLLRQVESLWLLYAPSMRLVCSRYAADGIDHDYHRIALAALETRDEPGFCQAIAADIRQGMQFIASANAAPR